MDKFNWQGETIVVATAHRKEEVIAPVLSDYLGARVEVISIFNSDEFGTFSGEIERKGSPLEVARAKCERAIELSGCQLAISSEGSFGPHPQIGFVPVDEEIVFFLDKKNDIEAHFRELSIKTNYGSMVIGNYEELEDFAKKALFPSHGLILSNMSGKDRRIVKGINSWDVLNSTFEEMIAEGTEIKAETDMRAMFNPMRMLVIDAAARGLMNQLTNYCESCGHPNFRVQEVRRGLPCGRCNFPTRSVLSHVMKCDYCGMKKEIKYPFGKIQEDPQYCDCCNP